MNDMSWTGRGDLARALVALATWISGYYPGIIDKALVGIDLSRRLGIVLELKKEAERRPKIGGPAIAELGDLAEKLRAQIPCSGQGGIEAAKPQSEMAHAAGDRPGGLAELGARLEFDDLDLDGAIPHGELGKVAARLRHPQHRGDLPRHAPLDESHPEAEGLGEKGDGLIYIRDGEGGVIHRNVHLLRLLDKPNGYVYPLSSTGIGRPKDRRSGRGEGMKRAETESKAKNGLLEGRRALVTGAARGIGAAIADMFEEAGAAVTRCDIRAAAGMTRCDVTDEGEVEAAFEAAIAGGPLDDVVHAAGIVTLGSVAETSLAKFREVIEVNLIGSFLVARAATHRLRAGGNLVFIASQAGLKGGPLWGAYSASKGGVLRLADCLVGELAEKGIRVNSISPGNVDTEMTSAAIAETARRGRVAAAEIRRNYERAIPLQRFATPQEIGRAAVALCSPLLSYANGVNLVIDGGELSR
jgi:NAD(P)-dependent dehydrogenase (short-subunit alcohol dehydrogenase family)